MKKYGTLIALAVAVIFGIAAVILANKWLSSQGPEDSVVIKQETPLTQVVVAGKDLEMGSMLSKENLAVVDWPKAHAPQGTFGTIDDVAGRVTVVKMVAGTPLVAAELAAEGSGVGLVAAIEPGKRAMAIRVDEVVGVGGFILPNTFVDIIAVQGKAKNPKTILEYIEVLAIAQETFTEEGKAKVVRTVTLELEPRQAELLAAETNKSHIHLVLRNPLDEPKKLAKKPEPKPVVAKKRTAKRTYKPKPAPKKPSTYDIVVIQGTRSVDKVSLPSTD